MAPDHSLKVIYEALKRPEMAAPEGGLTWSIDEGLATSFRLSGAHGVRVAHWSLGSDRDAVVHVRHALELAWLVHTRPLEPVLAGLAAARTAALFAAMEGWTDQRSALGRLRDVLSADAPPSGAALAEAWALLAPHQPDAPPAVSAEVASTLRACWPLLGPAEVLMERGGDVRLRIDPTTGLNAYGCSHRPRPWAITFASSTASSSSERGYLGAEALRRRITLAALDGAADAALVQAAAAIRGELRDYYALPPGSEVILAASGTDCELFSVAIAQLAAEGKPITNLLIAPDETGSGVPLAAQGRHFAVDTSRQVAVEKGALIAGFSPEIGLVTIPIAETDGRMRPAEAIGHDYETALSAAVADGHRVVAHLLDVSKLGRAAPDPARLGALLARYPGALSVVVDACQARLSEASIRAYLETGWIVQITGSKFFTGPPFSGALLLPPPIAARLTRSALPGGLRDYACAANWPAPGAAGVLAETVNYGLLLRWSAALAEMQAFQAVPAARRRAILDTFCEQVRALIAASPDLELVAVPPIDWRQSQDDWDAVATIVSFCVLAPGAEGGRRGFLDPASARRVYRWLNADIGGALPETAPAEDRRLAAALCHVGQPVPLAVGEGLLAGALRVSAGARLISGEPSHAHIPEHQRLSLEIQGVETIVRKISLILRLYDALAALDLQPRFR